MHSIVYDPSSCRYLRPNHVQNIEDDMRTLHRDLIRVVHVCGGAVSVW